MIWIDVPPLRERPDDIPLLARYFLGKQQEGETQKRLTDDALPLLKQHPWPGNVRELKNIIERISIMADEEELTAAVVSRFLDARDPEDDDPVVTEFDGMGLNEARDTFEKRYLESKLRDHGFNISRTATDLGIYPSSLHAKIKKYGIQVER